MTLTAPLLRPRSTAIATLGPLGSGLVERLHAEWDSMRTDPSVLRRAEGWDLGVSFDCLDDIVVATGWHRTAADRRVGGCEAAADAECVMTRLVMAARHDDVAARVVLQRLLPGLVNQARRWSMRGDGTPLALEELLPAAWVVIRTFPVGRRSGPLAPSLITDAVYHAFKRAGRRETWAESYPREHFEQVAGDRRPHAWDEVCDVLLSLSVTVRPFFTPADRRLLGLLLEGCAPEVVAEQLGVSVRTVTNRRHDLVERLRRALQVERV